MMNTRHHPLVLFLFTLAAVAGAAAAQKDYRIPHEKFTLSNGMDVILHVDRSKPTAVVYLGYHAGKSRERVGQRGLAHLIEHLMYPDQKKEPAGSALGRIRSAGGTVAVEAQLDVTTFQATLPVQHLEATLREEAERMGSFATRLTDELFRVQKRAVLDERRENFSALQKSPGSAREKWTTLARLRSSGTRPAVSQSREREHWRAPIEFPQ
jgi:zinc protease